MFNQSDLLDCIICTEQLSFFPTFPPIPHLTLWRIILCLLFLFCPLSGRSCLLPVSSWLKEKEICNEYLISLHKYGTSFNFRHITRSALTFKLYEARWHKSGLTPLLHYHKGACIPLEYLLLDMLLTEECLAWPAIRHITLVCSPASWRTSGPVSLCARLHGMVSPLN